MGCGRNAYEKKQVDLASATSLFPIGQRNTRYVSLIVKTLPAGLTTAEVAWGNKPGFPVSEGECYAFDPEENGIFFTWSPNLPGQEALFILGVDDGDGSGIERTA